MTKPSELPPVGRPPRPEPTPMEALYLRALVHWYRHRKEPPSLAELADLCRRSRRPGSAGYETLVGRDWPSRRAVRRGLLALEEKGYTKRNDQGKFEVIR